MFVPLRKCCSFAIRILRYACMIYLYECTRTDIYTDNTAICSTSNFSIRKDFYVVSRLTVTDLSNGMETKLKS